MGEGEARGVLEQQQAARRMPKLRVFLGHCGVSHVQHTAQHPGQRVDVRKHAAHYHLSQLVAGRGWHAVDDQPLPVARIVEINGLADALWCCRVEPGHDREWRLYAIWCARQMQHLMTDPRSIAALDVAERHVNGLATDEELNTAQDAARYAAQDARDARDAAWDAWEAAAAARDAACASYATRAAGYTLDALASWAAARSEMRHRQTVRFLEVVS